MCDPRHVKRKSRAAFTGRAATLSRHTLSGVGVVVSLSWETRGNECVSFIPKERKGGGVVELIPAGAPSRPPIAV